ncbi:MAG TPA: sulfite oxidase-like oxidoreductase [Candidatus Acidoferrales bacterium]|jgi:DMSO/TMAO reductase YedYZ molybdopterin-dependent catalytic subunit|nr:sulfite oxidase-like oxidoreductase [Candidatus Acidoferrales bacterium]
MAIFEASNERRAREREMRAAGRLPAGQSLTLKWPVLHEGPVPEFNPATWDFRVYGRVAQPLRLSWQEFTALPQSEVLADMHCVTRWSRFDNQWGGVLATELMSHVTTQPGARQVMVHAEHGYTSNLPLEDFLRPSTIFALRHDGEPLAPEHGYPLRLVVPHLYAWKSVKWVRGIELIDREMPGFWERNGYHIYGDPFKEERYSSSA